MRRITIALLAAALALTTQALGADRAPALRTAAPFTVPLADGNEATAFAIPYRDGQALAYLTKEGRLAIYLLTPAEQPGPSPTPTPPTPPPPPPTPPAPTKQALRIIVIEETADRTPANAHTYATAEFRATAKAKGHEVYTFDKDQTATWPAARAAGKPLPYLILTTQDKTPAVCYEGPCPAGKDLEALITKHGG